MRKISEMYKLYRDVPLFQALVSALEELSDDTGPAPPLLSLHQATAAVHLYDRLVLETVSSAASQYSLSGRLAVFRILQDHTWLLLTDATVTEEKKTGDSRREKRGRNKAVVCDKLLLRCYNPHADPTYEAVKEDEQCPYTVEVKEMVRERKKKKRSLKQGKKEAVVPGGYNPALHATMLGGDIDQKTGSMDWNRPQPYNEKLRQTRTEEERLALARTQVGMVDALKGNYRKRAIEYPHRCVEAPKLRPMLDLQVLPGSDLAATCRNYRVILGPEDRSLAQWCTSTGGTLALAAHNIHVAGEGRLETREKYGTRRHDKIESLTFDSEKNFASVDKNGKHRKRADRSSSSSSSSTSSSDTNRKKTYEKGWSSFGNFQIPKKPKPLVPCPKSMRENLRNPLELSNNTGSAMCEHPEKIEKDTENIVKINDGESCKKIEVQASALEFAAQDTGEINLDFLDNVELETLEPKQSEYNREDMFLDTSL